MIGVRVETKMTNELFDKIRKNLSDMSKLRVVIRIKPNAQYENGEKVEDTAVKLEYGSEGFSVSYPARPFWRSGIDANLPRIKKRFEFNLKQVAKGRISARQAYEDLGKQVVQYLKRSIREGVYAPLKASTIQARKAKGNTSTKPLIDTRLLLNSIEYKVEGA